MRSQGPPRQPEAVAREEELDRLIEQRPKNLFEILRDALVDDDEEVRSTAAYGLGELNDSRAVSLLIRALDSDVSDSVAEHSLKALETYVNSEVQQALVREAKRLRRRRAPRRMAALQLGAYDSPDSVAVLAALLSDEDVAVRDAALESLLRLRPRDEARWQALYDASLDRDRQPG
jgi:HEAT repeat protein